MTRFLPLAVLAVATFFPQTSQAQTPFGVRLQFGDNSFSFRNGYSYVPPTYVYPTYAYPTYVVPQQTIVIPSRAYPSWYGPSYLDYDRWNPNTSIRYYPPAQLYPPTHGPYRHYHR